MDEFRLWDRALLQAEIRDRMHHSLRGDEDNLVVYYNFDDRSSTNAVRDQSGNGKAGLLRDGTRFVGSTALVNVDGIPQLSLDVNVDLIQVGRPTGTAERTVSSRMRHLA